MATQQSLKPQFFVTRQNGAMVPLIAMDELPIHVQIEGVSRSLSAFDIAGMTGVGVYEARHQYYVVSSMNNTRAIPFNGVRTPQTLVSDASKPNSAVTTPLLRPTTLSTTAPTKALDAVENQTGETSGDSVPSSTVSTEEQSKTSRPTTPPTSSSANVAPRTTTTTTTTAPLAWRNKAAPILANDAPPADPDPEMPPAGQKVYCSYWLRNGECNFAQQGCMFKHVMPLKLEVLEALGFRDLPDWYRKTYKVGSLRVNGGRNGLSYGILDNNNAAPTAKRVGLDAEATRRIIASHINALPLGGGRGGRHHHHHHHHHGDRHARAGGNHHRPLVFAAPRVPAAAVAADNADKVRARARANEKDRRDECLAAAFAADMNSELGDMMDDQMQKIREQEQAGWEEEQMAARNAAVDAGKTGETSESGSGKEGEKKVSATAAPAAPAAPAAATPTTGSVTTSASLAGGAGAPAVVGDGRKSGRGARHPRRRKVQPHMQKKT